MRARTDRVGAAIRKLEKWPARRVSTERLRSASYLFHGASIDTKSELASLCQHGLQAFRHEGVSFTVSPTRAIAWATVKRGGNVLLLRVSTRRLATVALRPETLAPARPDLDFTAMAPSIPPDWIEARRPGKWIPLRSLACEG